ncbi:MAG: hypothetical protein R3B82_13710 [Sandaracinaceae bacterium]
MSARVLLGAGVDRAAIDDAAHARGWPLLNLYRRDEGRPRQVVFGTGEWLLTFVVDHRIDATYVVVEGHDEDGLADEVRAALPTVDLDGVIAMIEGDDRVRGLCWLGVVGPDAPAEPAASLVAHAAADEDPRVRDAAAFAVEALGWPT